MDTVHIIGGGIGGLTLANTLQRAGIDFNLYEQAPKLTEVGAAIGISKAATDILDSVGLGKQILNAGSSTQHLHFADKNLNVIRALTVEWPGIIIHRAKLIDILSSNLPKEKIHLNRKLTHIKSESAFSTLHFSDGSEIKSGCTVVADGIRSVVRNQLFPELKIRYAQQTIWRGITPIQLPKEYHNTFTEIWNNSMRFLFAPMDDENVNWLAVKKAPVGGADNPDTIRKDLLTEYESYHPLVKELIQTSSNFIRNDLADLGSQQRSWYHNRIVFLGDSIHATTPNLAQGGCQAIEDAYCLSRLLKTHPGDYTKIFKTYQDLRKEKVSFIINTSWRLGKMAHHPVLSHLGKYFFKYAPHSFFINQDRKLNDLTYLNRG